MANVRQVVACGGAPEAIGPYSQAVRVGDWWYLSGQIPLDPATGQLVDGDVVCQMERVMESVGAILAAAGAEFGDVVKTTLYLVDLNDFAAVNGVYARYFQVPFPARATVGVAALPRGARVEMEAVVYRPESGRS
ncbi:MAG: RidA family protein [Magnetococcales bacterium]|nr:RidA family protein [Magnetococcales bacterium]